MITVLFIFIGILLLLDTLLIYELAQLDKKIDNIEKEIKKLK